MGARHQAIGRPVHEAEAHGIRILVNALPDSYIVYTNVELPTGRPGQTLEHDAVVIAPYGVFTVELKSWPGRIQGNRDRWTLADGTIVQSPIPLANHKANHMRVSTAARITRWGHHRHVAKCRAPSRARSAGPRAGPGSAGPRSR